MDAPNHNFITNNNIVTCNSHALRYGLNSYLCAYAKTHFPLQFYTSCLRFAENDSDPLQSISEIVGEAKLLDVKVNPPRFFDLEPHFYTDGREIFFGLVDIKGVGEAQLKKLSEAIPDIEAKAGKPIHNVSWLEFLFHVAPRLSQTVVDALIKAGALPYDIPRARMCEEYRISRELTKKELGYALTQLGDIADLTGVLSAVAVGDRKST